MCAENNEILGVRTKSQTPGPIRVSDRRPHLSPPLRAHNRDGSMSSLQVSVPNDASTKYEAWIKKNHKGGAFADGRKRWFVMEGFHVRYYKEGDTKSDCGCFDLRNVRVLHDSLDDSAPKGAIDIVLSEKKGGASNKTVTMLIPDDVREAWLRHLCSAASDDALPPLMKGHRDAELAQALDNVHALQKTASSTLGAAKTPRTPRRPSAVDVSAVDASGASLATPSPGPSSASSASTPLSSPRSRWRNAASGFKRLSTVSLRGSVGGDAGSTPDTSRTESGRSDSIAKPEPSDEYGENDTTWLPPAARRPSHGEAPGLRKQSSTLLDQIKAHADSRLEGGSTLRRKSLGLEKLNSASSNAIAFPSTEPLAERSETERNSDGDGDDQKNYADGKPNTTSAEL